MRFTSACVGLTTNAVFSLPAARPGPRAAFLVPDPQDLRLRLWVNDELQQDESTAA